MFWVEKETKRRGGRDEGEAADPIRLGIQYLSKCREREEEGLDLVLFLLFIYIYIDSILLFLSISCYIFLSVGEDPFRALLELSPMHDVGEASCSIQVQAPSGPFFFFLVSLFHLFFFLF